MICVMGIEWESEKPGLPANLKVGDMQQAFPNRPEPVISCDKDEIVQIVSEWYETKVKSVKKICYESEDGKRFNSVSAYEKYNVACFY